MTWYAIQFLARYPLHEYYRNSSKCRRLGPSINEYLSAFLLSAVSRIRRRFLLFRSNAQLITLRRIVLLHTLSAVFLADTPLFSFSMSSRVRERLPLSARIFPLISHNTRCWEMITRWASRRQQRWLSHECRLVCLRYDYFCYHTRSRRNFPYYFRRMPPNWHALIFLFGYFSSSNFINIILAPLFDFLYFACFSRISPRCISRFRKH